MAAQTDLFQAMTKLTELAEELEREIDGYSYGRSMALHVDKWRLIITALRQSERAGEGCRVMAEALVNHNDNARSFFQIANRIATELGTDALGTNFGAFAETTHNMLKRWHEVTNAARALLDKSAEG